MQKKKCLFSGTEQQHRSKKSAASVSCVKHSFYNIQIQESQWFQNMVSYCKMWAEGKIRFNYTGV